MSRGVSTDGVAKLRELSVKYRANGTELLDLDREIKQKTQRLQELRTELDVTRRNMIAQLEVMDCTSSGNMGWEHRIAAVLADLAAQGAQ